MAEVIKVNGKYAAVQVFESTRGLKNGDEVEFEGRMLEATLGPGLLSSCYDGLQNDLTTMTGVFLKKGEYTRPLDEEKLWDFTPLASPGDKVIAADWLGEVKEGWLPHKIMVPFSFKGEYTVKSVAPAGQYDIRSTIAVLTDESGEDVKVRWEIQTLKPIQISNIDLQEYIEQRQKFTTEEWIDFLMHTVGLNPETMNRREKFITLARLLPHVENNFNFMELGPKGTGKSHVFQELSPYGVLVSGGDVTSARLFVKMSGKREELGLVGYWDVVAWDEFELCFNQVHSSFFTRLHEVCPDLSRTEQRICALLVLNLSVKEIAGITHRSVRTVEASIYQIRKKMSIPTGTGTLAFLQDFLASCKPE